jgi:hypothetical protein
MNVKIVLTNGGNMYINGYNKEKVMQQIRAKNKGYQSYDGNTCLYRSEDNNACLVGCFIPDEKYKKEMEGIDARILINEHNIKKHMPLPTRYMGRLQVFHDIELDDFHGNDFYNMIEQWLDENIN